MATSVTPFDVRFSTTNADTTLGIGGSTLRNWLAKRKEGERDAPPADRQEDMAAELRRLSCGGCGRENEVLRQEREILKKAAAFFAKEGSW